MTTVNNYLSHLLYVLAISLGLAVSHHDVIEWSVEAAV
jgi:hypothetical protein